MIHYTNDLNEDIESYIKEMKGRIYTKKVSVVLYDLDLDGYHLISCIQRSRDECIMLTIYGEDYRYQEFSLPFISQLNHYYGHCVIIEDSSFVGRNIDDIAKERKYR